MSKQHAAIKREVAEALGFSSVGQMRRHARWLDRCRRHAEAVRALVQQQLGSGIIDIRPALAVYHGRSQRAAS